MSKTGIEEENSAMAHHSILSNQMEDDVIIDLKAMLLDRKDHSLSTSCCIDRVPHVIRKKNTESYTPKVVSIGPFHHGNSSLQNFEMQKQKYFKQFTERAQSSTILEQWVSSVKKSEQEIRACYCGNIQFSQNKLVKVILVDAIFIIELFWKCFLVDSTEDDAIMKNPRFIVTIRHDLLLFENQLPFFILDKLFNMTPLHHNQSLPSFLQLALYFFVVHNTQDLQPGHLSIPIKHFTDLSRTFHFQPGIEKRERQIFKDTCGRPVYSRLFYSASKLNEAGVKLKAIEEKCLLNLEFSEHVLTIPQIWVYRETEILFRNIIAFEQLVYPFEGSIVDYLLFLDDLINTSKDVDVLVDKGIIHNHLEDSDEVVRLFNGLCQGVALLNSDCVYHDIKNKLNEFCRDPWNKKKAALRSDYCRTPWQTAASIAAIVLIILTIIQTICSIIQVI